MSTPTPRIWQVVNLQGIHLRDVHAHSGAITDGVLKGSETIHLHYEATGADDPQASSVVVTVKLSLHLGQADVAPESAPLFITARYQAIYGRPASFVIEPDDLEDFAERNGVLNVWPYWRELTHSLFGRMDLSLPPIPLFRVPGAVQTPPSADQDEPTR
ncbi:hypothetical protein L6R46_01755 [Myxococcota bacterium]|nr:hypothetical protein [Myxococcota bacterium]